MNQDDKLDQIILNQKQMQQDVNYLRLLIEGPKDKAPDGMSVDGLMPMTNVMWQWMFSPRSVKQGADYKIGIIWDERLKLIGMCVAVGGIAGVVFDVVKSMIFGH